MKSYHIHTLHNKLRVVTLEMPHLHSAELALYIKAGGRNDPRGREGLSHFLEHIIFRGCETFQSSQELEHAFEAIGGAPNASTDADSTSFYSRIHPDHVESALEILAAMILRPLLKDIHIEKRIITEEAREDVNEKGVEVNTDTVISRMLWPNHPLGMPTVGTLSTIAKIELDDLLSHWKKYYVPNNAVLVVSGNIKEQQIISAATNFFGNWQPRELPKQRIFLNTCNKSTPLRIIHDSDSQVSLQLAFRTFGRKDPRLATLRLIRRLLAGGGSSRLYVKLREELGIIYSVEASIGSYDETGCLAIELSTAPESLLQAIEVTLDELVKISRQPVKNDELNRIKLSYRYDLEYSSDSAFEMGGRFGWGELMGVLRTIEEDFQEISAINSEQIQNVATEVFNPANLKLVAIGPVKRGTRNKTELLIHEFKSKF